MNPWTFCMTPDFNIQYFCLHSMRGEEQKNRQEKRRNRRRVRGTQRCTETTDLFWDFCVWKKFITLMWDRERENNRHCIVSNFEIRAPFSPKLPTSLSGARANCFSSCLWRCMLPKHCAHTHTHTFTRFKTPQLFRNLVSHGCSQQKGAIDSTAAN